MQVHAVKTLCHLCGFTSYVSMKEGRTSERRFKMTVWGGLEALLYVTCYSKLPAAIELCKRVDYKNQLSKSEIAFIIETIKKGTSGSVLEENKSNEAASKDAEESISFSRYFLPTPPNRMLLRAKGNWSQVVEFLEEVMLEIERANVRKLKLYTPVKNSNSSVRSRRTLRAEARFPRPRTRPSRTANLKGPPKSSPETPPTLKR